MSKHAGKNDKILLRKFGQKVIALRHKRQMRQKDLADKLFVSTSYLSGIERGVKDPTISIAKRIAKTFRLSLLDMFDF